MLTDSLMIEKRAPLPFHREPLSPQRLRSGRVDPGGGGERRGDGGEGWEERWGEVCQWAWFLQSSKSLFPKLLWHLECERSEMTRKCWKEQKQSSCWPEKSDFKFLKKKNAETFKNVCFTSYFSLCQVYLKLSRAEINRKNAKPKQKLIPKTLACWKESLL